MKLRAVALLVLAIMFFMVGEAISLSLSGMVLWGELESRLQSNFSADTALQLDCPFMIAPAETAVITTQIHNFTERAIEPVVKLQVNQTERESKPVLLAARASQPAAWSVDSSKVNFKRLILINVLQSQYRDNPARWGACGILVYSLFGLAGRQTFNLLFASGIIFLLLAVGFWVALSRQTDTRKFTNIVQVSGLLAVMTVAALFSCLPRWWGLTLFLDAFNLLLIGIILFDLLLFPQKNI